MKPSGIGGMAVIEGVMMKNQDEYAIAVRKTNKKIVVVKREYKSLSDRVKIFKLPILRGVAAFIDSMVIGVGSLNFSASLFEEEEDLKGGAKSASKLKENIVMAGTVLASVALAVVLFMILPFVLSHLLRTKIESNIILSLIEGAMRLILFIGYVLAISRITEIKRVFQYHGAEHKTINCLENGFELTVENVKWQSKEHKRCGTSFMLYIMIISIIFFLFITVDNLALRIIIRLLLVPVIAGISYEFIRLAGKSNSLFVAILSKPGMWLQRLTTNEPDEEMMEVAIASVDAISDWEGFLEDSFGKQVDSKKTKTNKKPGLNIVKTEEIKSKDKRKKTRKKKTKVEEKTIDKTPSTKQNQNKNIDKGEKVEKAKDKIIVVEKEELEAKEEVVEVKKEILEAKEEALETKKEVEEEDDILAALDKYFGEE